MPNSDLNQVLTQVVDASAPQDKDLTKILLNRDDDLLNLQQKLGMPPDEKVQKIKKLLAVKIREARSR
jgi:hypothetical protein